MSALLTNSEDQDHGDNLVNVSANVITKFAKYIKFTDENVYPLPYPLILTSNPYRLRHLSI